MTGENNKTGTNFPPSFRTQKKEKGTSKTDRKKTIKKLRSKACAPVAAIELKGRKRAL
jgi:hypothetical protein